jgi:hypothetical protein
MGDAEVGVEIQIESSLLKAGPAEVYLALEQDLAKFVANAFDLLCHRGGTAWCVSLIGDAESAPDVDGWVRHLCQFFRDRKAPEDIRMAVEVKREWWVDVYPEQRQAEPSVAPDGAGREGNSRGDGCESPPRR